MESNLQAASATVSSLGAKTRGAVSSTVSFLQEKGVVSGAHGLVASAGSTAKSVFALAQSGWQGFWGSAASESEAESVSHAIVSDSIQVETRQSPRVIPSSLQQVSSIRNTPGSVSRPPG